MPEEMERKLKEIAYKKGYSKERTGAFVYGTMRHKAGWVPSTQQEAIKRKLSKYKKPINYR